MKAFPMFLVRRFALLALAVVALSGACSTCPTSPPATVASRLPPAPPPQESLLEYLPPQSIAALVVRKHAFSYAQAYFDERKGLQQELSELMVNRLGMDLTRIEGMLAYVVDIKDSAAAVFFRFPGESTFAPKLPPAGVHLGVPLFKVDSMVFLSVIPGGVVLGSENGVKAAIGHSQAKTTANPTSIVAILDGEAKDAEVALAIKAVPLQAPEVDQFIADYGLRHGLITMDREQLVTLRVKGDGRRLGAVVEMIKAAESFALSYLELEKNKSLAGQGLPEAIGSTVGLYEARRFFKDTEPSLSGDVITSRYKANASMGGTVLMGVMAAIAVPAFSKYVKSARSDGSASSTGAADPTPEPKVVAKPRKKGAEGKGRKKEEKK